ncbi:unnamed protein product [Adineta ricciae]|uniref:Uncharacterized protein n=1 Tax=Adineta ricciae TaxID=249248 RepID=A0A815NH17_ADIRI|nr:unnamed protein product [Adineta ricciae]
MSASNTIGNVGIDHLRELLKFNHTLTELNIGFRHRHHQGNLVNNTNTRIDVCCLLEPTLTILSKRAKLNGFYAQ